MTLHQNLISKIQPILENTEFLVITCGAGMGVDSGLPDFRGTEGFWNAYPPMKKLNLTFPEMATPRWFHSDPTFAWGFYGHRYNLYTSTSPHSGFQKLLNFGKKTKYGYFVVTSNVDSHFQKAGFLEKDILEVHGSISYLQCSRKCCSKIIPVPRDQEFELDEQTFRIKEPNKIPRCPSRCGDIARPNILLFEDRGWVSDRTDQQEKIYSQKLNSLPSSVKMTVIEVGAGKAVPTIRMESQRLLWKFPESVLIRINPREPEVTQRFEINERAFSIPMKCLEALEALGL